MRSLRKYENLARTSPDVSPLGGPHQQQQISDEQTFSMDRFDSSLSEWL